MKPATGETSQKKSATQNACKLCSPLGAAMVFKGIQNCLPFLHGSQGCATYIRRYLISHFREPVDIASSSFSEEDAIFGGARNFADGLANVIAQYHPDVIGVATTCLSETIGENMIGMIRSYQEQYDGNGPPLVHVSTPAYTGTHTDGFHAAVKAVLQAFAHNKGPQSAHRINVLPGMVSCADLRHVKALCSLYGFNATLVPDYSDTLEGESWQEYHRISPGGTSIAEIGNCGTAAASIELGHCLAERNDTAAAWLQDTFAVPRHALGLPIGIRLSDQFFTTLASISGKSMPPSLRAERGRLIDAYVDAHKYLSGKTAMVFGDPDLVVGMAAFLSEVGVRPIICGTGAKVKNWQALLGAEIEGGIGDIEMVAGTNHAQLSARARERRPDLLIGSSKALPISRELGVPLMRIGFPIHDRFGAQRQLMLGYAGTQSLFDQLVNLCMTSKQDASEIGYSYL